MGEVIGFVSLKGGVGKTTLAAAVASELANQHRKKVLLVDANYSAPNLGLHMDIIAPAVSIHDVLNGKRLSSAIHEKFGVDVVPGNFLFSRQFSPMKLRAKLSRARNSYDYIILDASPSLNDEIFSSMLTSDRLFIVTTPDYPSLSCCMKTARIAKQRGKEISGVIVNRVVDKKFQVGLEEIQESTGIPVVAMIGEDKNVHRALIERMPVNLTRRKSSFSKEISKLGNTLAGKKFKRTAFQNFVFKNYTKDEVNRELLRQSFYQSIFKR